MKWVSIQLVAFGTAMLAAVTLAVPASHATEFSFTTINDPDGSNTQAYGINNHGDVVGYFMGTGGLNGFVLDGGTFRTINDPNATNGTVALGINDLGQIVGAYFDGTQQHGFIYSRGTFTTVNAPSTPFGTEVYGINDRQEIVGSYPSACAEAGSQIPCSVLDYGFELNVVTGQFDTIDYPCTAPQYTISATGINNRDQIVGERGFCTTGFLESGGAFTNINVPNAELGTFPSAINDSGEIAGYADLGINMFSGFVTADRGRSFELINDPSAVMGGPLFGQAHGTLVTGLNDRGDLVGTYYVGTTAYGFIAEPVSEPSSITVFLTALVSVGALSSLLLGGHRANSLARL